MTMHSKPITMWVPEAAASTTDLFPVPRISVAEAFDQFLTPHSAIKT